MAGPRRSLARGLLKERARAASFVFAPDRLRPNALSEMLARLSPYAFSLASPNAVREAICHHFAPSFALHAIEGLASRHPAMSARTRPALWQRLAVVIAALAVLAAMALAPVETIWAITLGLALLFVPLIALRLAAVYRLLVAATRAPAAHPRVPDHELPIYTLLVPLYREAHMLPGSGQGSDAARLPGGEARHQARPGGSGPRHHRRGACAWAARKCRDRGGAGASSAHQAESPQLRAAARPRRICGDLRRRGSPRTAASFARRSTPFGPVPPISRPCRRGSISITPARTG